MAFDVKNINFQTRKVVKASQFAVGGVIPITPEKPLKKVLNVISTCLVTEQNSIDYNHNMRGKINIEMLYLSEAGEYETAKAEFAFDHTENLAAENATYRVEVSEYSVDEEANTYVKLNFLTCAYLEGTTTDNFAIVTGEEENYYANNGSFEHVSYLQGAKSQTELEDKVEINTTFQKVLGYECMSKNNAATCGIDQIATSGEITLKLYCLTENGGLAVERQLEYSHEVAILGVNPEDMAKVNMEVSKLEYSFEDGEKPVINVKLTLDVDACAYRKVAETYIEDIFSTTKEIELTSECANYNNYIGQKTIQDEFVFEQKLEENREVLFASVESTNIAKLFVEGGKFVAEGVAKLNLVLRDENGEASTQTINAPFAIQKEVEAEGNVVEYHAKTIAKNVNVRDDKLELTLTILFNFALASENYVQYVVSVKELKDKEAETSAITIYVAGDGDTTFSVAKALSISPEKILSQNQVIDGKFEKGQRIFVYNPLTAEF